MIYRLLRVDPAREQRWNVYAIALLAFSLVSFLAVYALQRVQGSLPFNPTNMPGVAPLGAFNVAGQLHDQHELAVVQRRADDEPPHPDGRPGGAELRVGGRRHGRRRRDHPRHRPARPAHARQLLGRPDPHDAAHPAAALVRRRHPAVARRRRAELPRLTPTPRRSTAPSPPRSPSRSPAARSPARSRSSSSARTAAGSTTSTPPTRSRTARRSPTSSRRGRSSSSRSRSSSRTAC